MESLRSEKGAVGELFSRNTNFRAAALAVLSASLLIACDKKPDSVSEADRDHSDVEKYGECVNGILRISDKGGRYLDLHGLGQCEALSGALRGRIAAACPDFGDEEEKRSSVNFFNKNEEVTITLPCGTSVTYKL